MKTIPEVIVTDFNKPLKKPEPLTVEKLKALPGCENYNPQEAEAIVISIQKLAGLLLEFTRKQNNISIDNQHVVYLKKQNEPPNDAIPIFSPKSKSA